MKFEISEKEMEKFVEWKSKHEKVHTTVGDRYSFSFTPTSIGVFVSVYDPVTEEDFLLSDLDSF